MERTEKQAVEVRHDTLPQPTSMSIDNEDILAECDEDDLMTEQVELPPPPSVPVLVQRPLLRYRTSSSVLRNIELSTEGSLPAVMAPSMNAMRVFRAHAEHRGLQSPDSVFGRAKYVHPYPLGVRRVQPSVNSLGSFEWRALADLLLVDGGGGLHLWAVRDLGDRDLESAKLVGVVLLWAQLLESERPEDVRALLELRGVKGDQLAVGDKISVRTLNILGVGPAEANKDHLHDCKGIADQFVRPERQFKVWQLPIESSSIA